MKRSRFILVGLLLFGVAALACDNGPTAPGTDNPVTGIVTAIAAGPTHGTPVFLVEERPDEPDDGQKVFFHVSDQTEILIRLEADLLVPGSTADLSIGTTVRAWKGPIETSSYPSGTWAPRIEVIR